MFQTIKMNIYKLHYEDGTFEITEAETEDIACDESSKPELNILRVEVL